MRSVFFIFFFPLSNCFIKMSHGLDGTVGTDVLQPCESANSGAQ